MARTAFPRGDISDMETRLGGSYAERIDSDWEVVADGEVVHTAPNEQYALAWLNQTYSDEECDRHSVVLRPSHDPESGYRAVREGCV